MLEEFPPKDSIHLLTHMHHTTTFHPSSLKLLTAKVNPTEYEQSVIDTLNAEAAPTKEAKKRRRKRAKGPNPLSVKKSKTLHVMKPISTGVVSKSKVS